MNPVAWLMYVFIALWSFAAFQFVGTPALIIGLVIATAWFIIVEWVI